MELDSATIEQIWQGAAPFSDQPKAGTLCEFAKIFIDAHRRVPAGVSIEVGTRNGGSALLFLNLLEKLYPSVTTRPPLFTVDPYGDKPYHGGDFHGPALYGAEHFVAMKQLLAGRYNHAHFQMRSVDFLERLQGVPYWSGCRMDVVPLLNPDGSPTGRTMPMRVGIEHLLGESNVAFALLDGEHDVATIGYELECMWTTRAATGRPWMHPKGTIIVDNVDRDARTWPMLREKYLIAARPETAWAVVTGVR